MNKEHEEWCREKALSVMSLWATGVPIGGWGAQEKIAQALMEATQRAGDGAALTVSGWSTAENYLPPTPQRTGGWLANRDIEISDKIKTEWGSDDG